MRQMDGVTICSFPSRICLTIFPFLDPEKYSSHALESKVTVMFIPQIFGSLFFEPGVGTKHVFFILFEKVSEKDVIYGM